jgi:uncharacterized glyoxalase superfamily metalloenzyme YdcJ
MQQPWQLRAQFAERLCAHLDRTVTGRAALIDGARELNAEVAAARGGHTERTGSAQRLAVERQGAISVGSPAELAALARIFAAMGMYPTGFYDLRDLSDGTVPVIATGFRPNDPVELERNPFRVFASLLATFDRAFFSTELAARIDTFLDNRVLFPPRLLALADRAEAETGLADDDAQEFLSLATEAFTRPAAPVDRAWYEELAAVSSVAAQIAGVRSVRIQHLAPRVLDLDAFCARMRERGIETIGPIEGPPPWHGPDLLLRQASFARVPGPATDTNPGGIGTGSTTRRLGEVEARGIALTRLGRQVYDAFGPAALPDSEEGLAGAAFAVSIMTAVPERVRDGRPPAGDLSSLLAAGWLVSEPVLFEDFLPESAAQIFRSQLTAGRRRRARTARHAPWSGPVLDGAWLAGALQRELLDPDELYWLRSTVSEQVALTELGLRQTRDRIGRTY